MPDTVISAWIGKVRASAARPRRPIPTLWPLLATESHETVCCTLTEARLVRAYLTLFLVPWDDGARTVRLARFGAYEVRLIEFAQELPAKAFPLWLELHAHDTCCSLDSCGCDEFEEAVNAADELMARARELHRASGRA